MFHPRLIGHPYCHYSSYCPYTHYPFRNGSKQHIFFFKLIFTMLNTSKMKQEVTLYIFNVNK